MAQVSETSEIVYDYDECRFCHGTGELVSADGEKKMHCNNCNATGGINYVPRIQAIGGAT